MPLGYLGDADKTARTFPVIDGVRYSVPGDRARLTAEGLIELYGRDSVTINSGGEKIFAEEVEQALAHHPDVYDVVVAGRPSERWGQEVVAIVQLREGAAVDEAALLAEAETHIARYKLPKAFRFVDHIQRSPRAARPTTAGPRSRRRLAARPSRARDRRRRCRSARRALRLDLLVALEREEQGEEAGVGAGRCGWPRCPAEPATTTEARRAAGVPNSSVTTLPPSSGRIGSRLATDHHRLANAVKVTAPRTQTSWSQYQSPSPRGAAAGQPQHQQGDERPGEAHDHAPRLVQPPSAQRHPAEAVEHDRRRLPNALSDRACPSSWTRIDTNVTPIHTNTRDSPDSA